MNRFFQVVVIALLLVACKEEQKEQRQMPAYVKTEVIKNSSEQVVHSFNGTVNEKDDVILSFRVGGPLRSLNVENGDYVKKGQVIATIDQRDYKIQLRQTEVQLKQRKAEFARYEELFKKGKFPANNYDQAKMALELAQVAYDHAKNQLNDTRLIAPFSGYVASVTTDNFETVGPGMPVVSLIDVSKYDLSISVPSNTLSLFNKESKARAYVEGENKAYPIQIKTINHKAGKDDLYQVLFQMEGDDLSLLRAGMVAKVEINEQKEHTDAVTIPVSALFSDNGKHAVWVVNPSNNTVHKKVINISGFAHDGRVSVYSGLSNNERIVTAGIRSLKEGKKVELVKEKSKTNIGGLL